MTAAASTENSAAERLAPGLAVGAAGGLGGADVAMALAGYMLQTFVAT